MKMQAKVVIALMLLPAGMAAQGKLHLGEDRDAVVAGMGLPKCYQQGLVCVPTVPIATPGLPIWEVYERRTASNLYELWLRYAADDSQSRLNPTLRIAEIRFTLDRTASAGNAASDIDELRTLCLGGCDVKRQTGIGKLYLVPSDARGRLSPIAVFQFVASSGAFREVKDLSGTVSHVTLVLATGSQIGWSHTIQKSWHPPAP
jgi:hypothetical protein